MFRPRPALQALIDEELAQIPRPFIGLQVRHGDKCRGDRPDGPGTAAESFRTLDDRNRPEDMRIECGSFEEYMIHVQRLDLGVLAKADAFVGSLWSNVGRLSYELSAADKGCLPPLISRDVGWCSVDGQLQDGTVYGHLNC